MTGGWYPDPTGRFTQRWYDGHRWTGQVIAANGAAIDDPMPTGQRPFPPPYTAVTAPAPPVPPAQAGQAGQAATAAQLPPPYVPGQGAAPPPIARPAGAGLGTTGQRLGPGATLAVGLAGVALVALSLLGVPWLSEGEGFSFLDLSDAVRDTSGEGEVVVRGYAGFGGFILLVLTLGGAALGGIPVPGSPAAARAWQIAVAGLAGLGAVLHTVTVVRVFRGPASPEIGAWLGTVGYFVVIAAMVIGHYRRTVTQAAPAAPRS